MAHTAGCNCINSLATGHQLASDCVNRSRVFEQPEVVGG